MAVEALSFSPRGDKKGVEGRRLGSAQLHSSLVSRTLSGADVRLTERILRYAPRRIIAIGLEKQLRFRVPLVEVKGSAGRISSRFFFVADGEWDRNARPLSGSNAWRIMKSIHEADGEWRRCEEFSRMVDRVGKGYRGGRDYPMRDERDVLRYFETRAQIWRRCRERGIEDDWNSPIRFAVGRDGDYFKASDGAHRLACAFLLEQQEVPGVVWQIHPSFLQEFVQKLREKFVSRDEAR